MAEIENHNLSDLLSLPATIVVLGDTHLTRPEDRLDDELLQQVVQQKPDLILHTGDLMDRTVLDTLSAIAPTLAVRGNRDLKLWRQLPAIRSISFHDQRMILFHGYGNLPQYFLLKTIYTISPEKIRNADFTFPHQAKEYDFILYGHTHAARLERKGNSVIMNPGSFSMPKSGHNWRRASFGIIRFESPKVTTCTILQKNTNWHVYCKI